MAGVVLAAGTSSRMDAGFKLLLPHEDGTVVEAPVRAALRAGLDPVVVVTGHRGDEVREALEGRFGPQGNRASRGARRPPGPADVGPGTIRDGDREASSAASAAGDLRIVFNPRFPEGQAKSLARGILEVRTATEAAAAAVLLGDEPGLRADAVREVVEGWRRASASSYGPPSGAASSAEAGPSGRTSPGDPTEGSSDGPAARSGARSTPVVRARYRDRPGHPVVFPRDVFSELEALEGDRGARAWMERNAGRVEEVRLNGAAPADVDTDDDYPTTGR